MLLVSLTESVLMPFFPLSLAKPDRSLSLPLPPLFLHFPSVKDRFRFKTNHSFTRILSTSSRLELQYVGVAVGELQYQVVVEWETCGVRELQCV